VILRKTVYYDLVAWKKRALKGKAYKEEPISFPAKYWDFVPEEFRESLTPSSSGGSFMRDWSALRVRALELLREDWTSAQELARELHISVMDAKALLRDLSRRGLVFRDGPLYIAREGWA